MTRSHEASDEAGTVEELWLDVHAALDEMRGDLDGIGGADAAATIVSLDTLEEATEWLLDAGKGDIARAAAGATPYLRLFGTVAGGWLLAKGAAAASRRLAEGAGDPGFLKAKLATGRFYAENVLPQVAGLAAQVITGAESTLALDDALF